MSENSASVEKCLEDFKKWFGCSQFNSRELGELRVIIREACQSAIASATQKETARLEGKWIEHSRNIHWFNPNRVGNLGDFVCSLVNSHEAKRVVKLHNEHSLASATADKPQIHNLRMLDDIHRTVMKHSNNRELADAVWSYLRRNY